MGSEQVWSPNVISASPGGLVWVRRRNGSWWPARIVRSEELPQKMSLKSGTPIKLLGRDNGSMDWYNLEKSKRVKPFRCGEYDECIEKAKISALRSNKTISNTGKYVRREDAIIHALELEKAYFSTGKHGSSKINNSLIAKGDSSVRQLKRKCELESSGKQPGCSAKKHRINEENSMQELSQSVVSFELPNKLTNNDKQFMQKKRWRTPNDSEDDEGIKRMRDLQEIELGMPSCRKPNRHIQSKQPHGLALPHTTSPDESKFDSSFFSISQFKSTKTSSSLKMQCQVIQDHENVKRKDRRRLLTKVCEGSRVIIPSYCHWDVSFATQSFNHGISENLGAVISTSRKSDFSDTTSSSDTSGTSSDETLLNAFENTAMMGNIELDSEIKDSENSSMLDHTDNDCPSDLVNIPLVMSDNVNGDYLHTSKHHAFRKLQRHTAKMHSICSEDNLVSCYIEGLGESSFTGSGDHDNNVRQKKQKMYLEQHSNVKMLSAVDAPNSLQQSQKPFHHSRGSLAACSKHKFPRLIKSMQLDFSLYDVELTVQTSYHGRHVPLVSLMSRFNGKAIVGHPVTVEVLKDGATNAMVTSNDFGPSKHKADQSSRYNDNKIGRRPPRNEHLYHKYNHTSSASSFKRKLSNNKNPRLLSRKIRKLSSISIDQKAKEDRKLVVEKIGGPVVACVPLRLVFSRITEALGCSARSGSIS